MVGKKAIRKHIQQLASSNDFSAEDAHANATLLEFIKQHPIGRVFAYLPLEDEVDLRPFLSEIQKITAIALPRCNADLTLDFILIEKDWHTETKSGSYGILEPFGHNIVVPARGDLMLVPGVAFTMDGKRLGRGKGFYDRYLAVHGNVQTIGICRSYQAQEDLPLEPWDLKVDQLLCAGNLYTCLA